MPAPSTHQINKGIVQKSSLFKFVVVYKHICKFFDISCICNKCRVSFHIEYNGYDAA